MVETLNVRSLKLDWRWFVIPIALAILITVGCAFVVTNHETARPLDIGSHIMWNDPHFKLDDGAPDILLAPMNGPIYDDASKSIQYGGERRAHTETMLRQLTAGNMWDERPATVPSSFSVFSLGLRDPQTGNYDFGFGDYPVPPSCTITKGGTVTAIGLDPGIYYSALLVRYTSPKDVSVDEFDCYDGALVFLPYKK